MPFPRVDTAALLQWPVHRHVYACRHACVHPGMCVGTPFLGRCSPLLGVPLGWDQWLGISPRAVPPLSLMGTGDPDEQTRSVRPSRVCDMCPRESQVSPGLCPVSLWVGGV